MIIANVKLFDCEIATTFRKWRRLSMLKSKVCSLTGSILSNPRFPIKLEGFGLARISSVITPSTPFMNVIDLISSVAGCGLTIINEMR
jgi:hypothetical protein